MVTHLEADKVERLVDGACGQDGDDAAEAAQGGQRHRRALLVLYALQVRRYHALQTNKKQKLISVKVKFIKDSFF